VRCGVPARPRQLLGRRALCVRPRGLTPTAAQFKIPLVNPPVDDYPTYIEAAIRALVSDGIAAGAAALEPIAYPPQTIARRPSVPLTTAARLFKRDRFSCRYCGRKTITTPIMALLGGFYPQSFPDHPNWKGGVTHPAIITRSSIIDHVHPGTWGGDWNADENLVTACWPCNAAKSDLSLEQLRVGPTVAHPRHGLGRTHRSLPSALGRSWQSRQRRVGSPLAPCRLPPIAMAASAADLAIESAAFLSHSIRCTD
jgi:HNH endonuclease